MKTEYIAGAMHTISSIFGLFSLHPGLACFFMCHLQYYIRCNEPYLCMSRESLCIFLHVRVDFHYNTGPALLRNRVGTKHSEQHGTDVLFGISITLSCCATSHLTSRFSPTCLFSLQLVPCFPQSGRQRECSL